MYNGYIATLLRCHWPLHNLQIATASLPVARYSFTAALAMPGSGISNMKRIPQFSADWRRGGYGRASSLLSPGSPATATTSTLLDDEKYSCDSEGADVAISAQPAETPAYSDRQPRLYSRALNSISTPLRTVRICSNSEGCRSKGTGRSRLGFPGCRSVCGLCCINWRLARLSE